jgi:hypothetical protein
LNQTHKWLTWGDCNKNAIQVGGNPWHNLLWRWKWASLLMKKKIPKKKVRLLIHSCLKKGTKLQATMTLKKWLFQKLKVLTKTRSSSTIQMRCHWFGDTSNCKVPDQINDEHHNRVAYIKQKFLLRKKEVTHWAWIDGTFDSWNFQTIQLTLVPLTRLKIVLQ